VIEYRLITKDQGRDHFQQLQELLALKPSCAVFDVRFTEEDGVTDFKLLQVALHIKDLARHVAFLLVVESRNDISQLVQSVSEETLVCGHNLRKVVSLFRYINPQTNVRFFDTQLAMELKTGAMFATLAETFHYAKLPYHPSARIWSEMGQRPGYQVDFNSVSFLTEAAEDVVALVRVCKVFFGHLSTVETGAVKTASESLARYKQFVFDTTGDMYKITSAGLLIGDAKRNQFKSKKYEAHEQLDSVLSCLPEHVSALIREKNSESQIHDIALDLGKKVRVFCSERLTSLCDDIVDKQLLEKVIHGVGEFGNDNRAGIDGTLHRISAMRNRQNDIYGLTIRIGRVLRGCADHILDLVLNIPKKGGRRPSILLVGEPGSGKSSILREIIRVMSESGDNVCVVDTSNELCGDGDIPHPSLADARRMMVPSLDSQSAVMIECVQNHTPSTIVIDEIGRRKEEQAARTVKARGVRLFASVHGTFSSLVHNPDLNGLLGGLETVILSDQSVRNTDKKVRTQRAGPSTFDVILELSRARHGEVHIIRNVDQTVDQVLQGKPYTVEVRFIERGRMFVDMRQMSPERL
jgi:stage III sporulation protein SpoIIIAA